MTPLPSSQGAESGTQVAETGRLVREPGGFVLQCEHGGRLPLLLPIGGVCSGGGWWVVVC